MAMMLYLLTTTLQLPNQKKKMKRRKNNQQTSIKKKPIAFLDKMFPRIPTKTEVLRLLTPSERGRKNDL